jgi:putative colanic acid biosynthesis UDP-glucose lipid carrier transferase
MNFVERQAGETAPRTFAASEAVRKWPIRYRSIEALAICTDLATILLASVISTLLYHINGGWTATDIEKAAGHAIVAAALFASANIKLN